ncbi:MAG: GH32 C-terminal domain-containing protein, partial [Mucilaginibacter sp.]
IVDQTRSTKKKYIPLNIRTGDYAIEGHKKVNFHLFFDGSVIEGFINNEDAFTTRIFPESVNSTQIALFSEGGNLKVLNGTSWQLKSSNNKTDF